MVAQYLKPDPLGPAPLQGQALNDFFQEWMVGLTGLDGTMVRAYDQAEPPVIPDAGVAWMAFRQSAEDSDTFPFIKSLADGTGVQLQRNERIRIMCSFYDLGTNGLAAQYASLLRDGLAIPQNLEILQTQNMGIVGTEPEVVVPSLLKVRWLYRVDLFFRVSRQVTRNYLITSIEEAELTLNTDTGLPPIPITVENDT